MKKIITAAVPFVAALAFAGQAHASADAAYAACSDMTFQTYMGSSNNGYNAPLYQAIWIRNSQGASTFSLQQAFTYLPEGISFSCGSRYEYRDYYGVYRLIKIETHPQYDGAGNVQSWSQWSRNCYYRSSPANSWTPYSC